MGDTSKYMPFEKIMERSGGPKEATDVWVIRFWNFKTVYSSILPKPQSNLARVCIFFLVIFHLLLYTAQVSQLGQDLNGVGHHADRAHDQEGDEAEEHVQPDNAVHVLHVSPDWLIKIMCAAVQWYKYDITIKDIIDSMKIKSSVLLDKETILLLR